MKGLVKLKSDPKRSKVIFGAMFLFFISYLSFCNGEHIGRFIYTALTDKTLMLLGKIVVVDI